MNIERMIQTEESVIVHPIVNYFSTLFKICQWILTKTLIAKKEQEILFHLRILQEQQFPNAGVLQNATQTPGAGKKNESQVRRGTCA